MKRKLLSVILAAVMTLALIPAAAYAADTVADGTCGANGDNITWTLDSDGTMIISGEGEMYSYDINTSRAPWFDYRNSIKKVVIEEGVTSIGSSAFMLCTNLTEIQIPDSLTDVGAGAFFDTAFYDADSNWEDGILYIGDALIGTKGIGTNVTIKPGTKIIAKQAFRNSSVESINIPESVKYINYNAFYRSKLKSLEITGSEVTIDMAAFSGCTDLKTVKFSDNCTLSIGQHAFENCENLETIEMSNKVTYIGRFAFNGTYYYKPENGNWENGVLYIDNALIQASNALAEPVTIKEGTTLIAEQAFFHCENLEYSIEVPEGLKYINPSAFSSCGMTSINIPASVVEIGDHAFSFCLNLTEAQYGGLRSKWNTIKIGINNNLLLNVIQIAEDPVPEYNISVINGGNGTVQLSAGKAKEGDEITVTAIPNYLYMLSKITYTPEGGSPVDITSTKKFTMPAKAVTVNVTFKLEEYPITVKAGSNGSASASKNSAETNEVITVTAKPNSGYEVDKITYTPEGESAIDITSEKWFTMPQGPVTVNVTFKAIKYPITLKWGANGTANVSAPSSEKGKTITVTATPDSGYEVDKITYTPEGGSAVDITSAKKFTMPAKNVIVEVTFKAKAPAVKAGDLNGDGSVNAKDKAILNRYLAGWKGYDAQILSREAADIDGSGKIDAKDKAILNRYLAGWDGYDKYFE